MTQALQPSPSVLAFRDIVASFGWWRVWFHFALREVRTSYRRALIGAIWAPVSLVMVAMALSYIFKRFVGLEPDFYVVYLACGLLTWQFINSAMNNGATVFITQAALLRQTRVPCFALVLKSVLQHTLFLLHNLLGYAFLLAFTGMKPPGTLIAFIPALILLVFTALGVTLLFGIIGVVFRDFAPLLAPLTRFVFFATPVLWSLDTEQGKGLMNVMRFNPFYHYLELMRAPMLGEWPAPEHWGIAVGITAAVSVVALLLFRKMRSQIVYWL